MRSFVLLFILTLVLNVYHLGVVRKPDLAGRTAEAKAAWYDKKDHGIHHMVLIGPPYGRGVKSGELTKSLLLEQEDTLVGQLQNWFPKRWMLQGLVLASIAWFHGVEDHIEPAHLEEMYGTSLSAPKEYDDLADGFSRQVAYHGLHEVGQMMVDQGIEDMGCTVAAVPRGDKWIIGRNFDFEAGRVFDSEKIVKWIFPERGHAFVSVIWAGMVGAVTGVNQKGLYASINAAGSEDFARVGTPSTLVLLKVLQEAATTEEAIEIFKNAKMFITDIFVVADAHGNLVRIEKSPKRMAVLPLKGPSVVANHLLAREFANDDTNRNRREELTTEHRMRRGEQLVAQIQAGFDNRQTVDAILGFLRDKGENLALGHRQAIDAAIATHAVIHDGERGILYVSEGPALTGKFRGYDLEKSFAFQKPVLEAELPPDPLLSPADFYKLKETNQKISKAHRLLRKEKCVEGRALLDQTDPRLREQSPYYFALGDAHKCYHEPEQARQAWQRALDLIPAYARETRELKRRLER